MERILDVVKEFKFIRDDTAILLMGSLIINEARRPKPLVNVRTHDHFFLFPCRNTIYSSFLYILLPWFSVLQFGGDHNQRSSVAIKPEKHNKTNGSRWE